MGDNGLSILFTFVTIAHMQKHYGIELLMITKKYKATDFHSL